MNDAIGIAQDILGLSVYVEGSEYGEEWGY